MFRCEICNGLLKGSPINRNGEQMCHGCYSSIRAGMKEPKPETEKMRTRDRVRELDNPVDRARYSRRRAWAKASNSILPHALQGSAPKPKVKNVNTLEDDRLDTLVNALTAAASADKEERAYDNTPTVAPPLKRVYICSPYRGNTRTNIYNARRYARFAFEQGFHPYAPHLYYPQFLDDNDPAERAAGLHYALMNMWQMEELWVFGSRISEGMNMDIELAEDLGIPVRRFGTDTEAR